MATANNTTNVTYTGFRTKVTLDGEFPKVGKLTRQLICTGLNINFGQKILNSSGSFAGGNLENKVIETQGMPRMDVPQITVGLTFQATETIVDLLITMMKNRKTKNTITIYNVSDYEISLTWCYWNKISFQVAQNQLMTCSVDFNVLQEYSTIYNFSLAAKQYNSTILTNTTDFGEYKGSSSSANIIPYYATGLEQSSDGKSSSYMLATAWSLDVSQMVQLKTFCKNNSSSAYSSSTLPMQYAPLASHIKFGMMNVNLNVTKLIDTSPSLVGGQIVYTKPSSNKITISSKDSITVKATKKKTIMILDFIQLISASPVLSDAGTHMAYQLNYQAHKVTLQ